MILLLAKLDALQGDRVAAQKRAMQYNALTRKKIVLDRSMVEFGLPLQHDFRWDPLKVDTFDNGYLFTARLQTPLEDKKRITLANQGNAQGAIAAAKTQLLQSPNDLFLLRELALAQMAAGDYAGSVDTFKKVLDSYPQCYVDLLHIARGLAMQAKGAEGAAYVKEFLSHVPNQQIAPALLNIGQEPTPPAVPEGVKRTTEEHEVKRTKREVPAPQSQNQNSIPASEF
jgi:tetratricopeptide (TPR) repeat protein